ncbi:hypothetical protein H310_12672 [Aphanomyces invadans]|uniref:Uncharacterized protein n=1 Tax=Aphanomyces invadans TaxID=157072 RepID=A0A024TJE3_9STRA|nr:hypothetical protein H310_12672 [Aphanomyces invadans]ETV93427.1 hypothetical protein H310_12672 [Aphanomyces invadans]|eukprot:XP_008878063.1 hypothetical protein H310_12672 [Aphanomyces invadans]
MADAHEGKVFSTHGCDSHPKIHHARPIVQIGLWRRGPCIEKTRTALSSTQQKDVVEHREHVLLQREAYKARDTVTIAAQDREYQQRNRDRINAY